MSELIIPPGKKSGCLPRLWLPGKAFPLFEDRLEVFSDDQCREELAIGTQSLETDIDEILDQDGRGSCATESTSQAVMISNSSQLRPHVLLSPWSIYAFTSDGKDGGSNIDRNLDFASRRGILPMEIWPRSKGWSNQAPDQLWKEVGCYFRIAETYDITTIAETRTALLRSYPVVFGWQGHSCVLIYLRDMDTADYANSWGADWNGDGIGQIRLSAINFRYGAFAVRTTVDSRGYVEARKDNLARWQEMARAA